MTEEIRPRWLSVINFLLIKVAWVACVVGGTLSGALVIALMFALCFYQGRWQRERGFRSWLSAVGSDTRQCMDSPWYSRFWLRHLATR